MPASFDMIRKGFLWNSGKETTKESVGKADKLCHYKRIIGFVGFLAEGMKACKHSMRDRYRLESLMEQDYSAEAAQADQANNAILDGEQTSSWAVLDLDRIALSPSCYLHGFRPLLPERSCFGSRNVKIGRRG